MNAQPEAAGEQLFLLTERLMRVDSTSGREGEVGALLASLLRERGYTVEEQPLPDEPTRKNVFAWRGTPRVVLTTHMDCVPPFIAPSQDDHFIYGRGSCDAKGPMAAMIVAADALLAAGIDDFGLLFVVGEENESSGAKHFARVAADRGIRYLIDGEPTGNLLTRGHKGVLALALKRKGVPGHSAYPELFTSALHPLLQELAALTQKTWPSDANFGETTVNVGVVRGGEAANVVAEHAEAQVMVRLARPLAEVKPLVLAAFSKETQVTIRSESDPAEIFVPHGYASEIVRFGSDVPHLRRVAEPLLVGPGSIHDAHTAGEKLEKKQQVAAVALYEKLVRDLLAAPDNGKK